MLTLRRFSAPLTVLLTLGSALAAVPTVQAQEEVAVEEIVVTGSRIKRSDLTSISPITVLSEQELEASGNVTLENFLQDLPSVSGGDFGSTVNNGNPGVATASLRGLGPNRTLLLVNGHRPAPAGVDGIVDLNMVPTSIIERVEVLRDGASVIYGSDAIAGVINIITKKDFEGFRLDTGYASTSEGDGDEYNIAATWGASFDRGRVVMNAQYTRREPIWQKDRSFSDCPLFDTDSPANGGVVACGGSPTTTPARFTAQQDGAVAEVIDGSVRAYDSELDAFNYAAVSYMVTPQDVYSIYGSAEYDLIEEGGFTSVTSFLEANFANRESDQLLAPVGTFWSPIMPVDHPANPYGNDLCGSATNPDCVEPVGVAISRRITESGGRAFTQDVDSWRIVAGFEGVFANGWTWDANYNGSKWLDAQRDEGRALQPRIENMLNPTLCAADPLCDPDQGGVGLWDPFFSDTMDPDQVAYGFVGVNTKEKSKLRIWQVNLQGDLMGNLDLPGGAIQWAAGYENRRETAKSQPDGGAAIGAVYFTPGLPTTGKYEVDELYGEVDLPILSGAPLADVLSVNVAARWTDYDFADDDTSYKFAIEYGPIEDVRVRYTYTEGFRGPNISELGLGAQKTAADYNEPCDNWGPASPQVIQDNCTADGFPQGTTVDAPQATSIEGGNENLVPETSETYTIGLVVTPRFAPNLSVTLDYFDIEIEDAIGTAGAGNIITACYNSVGFSDPFCNDLRGPEFVGETPSVTAPDRRNANQQISGIDLRTANLANFETAGVDFQVDYGFDTDWGHWDLRAMGTYLDKYEYIPFEGGNTQVLNGYFGTDPYQGDNKSTFPEWKVNYYVNFSRDNWGAGLVARWIDETDDASASPDNIENTADDVWYVDMNGYYTWNNFTFSGGVRNLLDEDPPYVTNYDDMNTIHYSYDTIGQYWYGRVRFDF